MKILNIQNKYAYNFKNYQNKSKNTVCEYQNRAIEEICNYPIPFLGNISFNGSKNSDIYSQIETKISKSMNPNDFSIKDMKSAIHTTSDLSMLSKILKEDRVEKFAQTGISLNSALSYLKRKNQIQLNAYMEPKNVALFVDKFSMTYLKKAKEENHGFDEYNELLNDKSLLFYSLNESPQAVKKYKERLEELFNQPIEIKEIKSHKNKKESKFPSKKELMTTFKKYANKNIPEAQERIKYIDMLTKYMNNSLECYSYQRIAKELKETYKKLEQHMILQGKSMDDVLYLIPFDKKSYDIINYIYACENNIPADRFIPYNKLNKQNSNGKVLAIIDDCSLSGASIEEIPYRAKCCNWRIVACPLVVTKEAEEALSKCKNLTLIPSVTHWTIGDFNNYGIPETFNNLSNENIKFLTVKLHDVYKNQCANVAFPYMIPDNCSAVFGKLGPYFLVNNCPDANKTIWNEILEPNSSKLV